MKHTTKFNWDNGITINDEFFPEDKLQRSRYAEFLTRLLESQGFDKTKELEFQKKNYVLNLNSEWGSGKTYFLKRWVEDIKSDHPVVYVDAWAKDYSDDPLMTVISAIIKQLREQAGKPEDETKFKAPRKLIGLLKAAAPGIARGITKRYLGIDPVKIMESDDGDELGNVKDQDGKEVDMSTAASEMVKYLLDEHEAKSNAIDDLKNSVQEWVNAVVGIKQISYPAFIFIDELDRCRPSYAIEMLETIKHIFNIKGIVFVVATDTEQLQHTIKAVYGEGFNAKVYLNRFFNSSYILKKPKLNNLLEVHTDSHKFSPKYLKERKIEIIPYNNDPRYTLENMATVFDAFQIPIRTSIQLAERITATLVNMPIDSKIDIIMISLLHCIKEKDSELFQEIMKGNYVKHSISPDGSSSETFASESILKMLNTENGRHYKINMYFTPKNHFKNLTNNFIHDENHYCENNYQFPLKEYITYLSRSHFNSMSIRDKNSFDKTKELSNTSIRLLEIPLESSRTILSQGNSMLWFKYIYYNCGYDKITLEEYKDYVELASLLNWTDKDKIQNI